MEEIDLKRNTLADVPLLWSILGVSLEKLSTTIYRNVMICSCLLLGITQLINIWKNIENFDEIASTCHVTPSILSNTIKLIILQQTLPEINEAIEMLALMEFQPRNESQQRFVKGGTWFAKTLVRFNVVTAIACVSMFTVAALFNHVLPFKTWLPFGTDDSLVFWMVIAWQVVTIFYVAFCAVGVDGTFFVLILQVASQLQVLGDKFENLKIENLRLELNKCVQHHQLVKE